MSSLKKQTTISILGMRMDEAGISGEGSGPLISRNRHNSWRQFSPSVSHITLNIHTDQITGSNGPVGSGDIGVINLPPDSMLTVGARGDFGGIVGDGTSQATALSFHNCTFRKKPHIMSS